MTETVDQTVAPRIDDELVAELKARLAEKVWVSSRGIWIDAKEGVIALIGVLDSEEEKTGLATMARAIEGCKGVENHLLVKSKLRGYGFA